MFTSSPLIALIFLQADLKLSFVINLETCSVDEFTEADGPMLLSAGTGGFPMDKNCNVCSHYIVGCFFFCLLVCLGVFLFFEGGFRILEGPDPESGAIHSLFYA